MDIFKRPMFYAAAFCCVAAVLSLRFGQIAIIFFAFSIIVLLFVVFRKKYQYITVIITIILFAVSLCFQFNNISKIKGCNYNTVKAKCLIASEPVLYDDFTTVTFKTLESSALPKGTKYLAFDYDKTNFKMGDIVEVRLKINFIDQYDEYYFYDYSNGIYATANIVELNKTSQNNFLYKTAGNIREFVKNSIAKNFKGDTAGFLTALTIGDKSFLSEQFSSNIKTTGISHIVVVSGMHLSIIMTAVFWVLDRMFYNKYIRSILSIAIVLLISAVCGFTMSIMRAGAMFIIAGLAPIFNRDSDSLSSLATAVTAVLIGAPFAIFNISFQLSVLSTLALIWVVPFYFNLTIKRFGISSKIIKTVVAMLLCSVFALIFTLPVTIRAFGFVSIIAPLTNILITYLVTMVLVINILALVLYALPLLKYLSLLIFLPIKLCVSLIVFLVNTLAKIPITVAVLPKNAFWFSIILIFALVVYMYYCIFKEKRSDLNANSV